MLDKGGGEYVDVTKMILYLVNNTYLYHRMIYTNLFMLLL